jgi:hypothetical protein
MIRDPVLRTRERLVCKLLELLRTGAAQADDMIEMRQAQLCFDDALLAVVGREEPDFRRI